MTILAGVATNATDFTKIIREFRQRNGDAFKIGVVEVTKKASIGIYWSDAGSKFSGIDGKFGIQDILKFNGGEKFIAAVPNASDLVKKNAIFVYDAKALGGAGAWGKIPMGYYKKLMEVSDIRKSVIETILDNKELDKQQAVLDEKKILANMIDEYNKELKKLHGALPSTRFNAEFRESNGASNIYFSEWSDWNLGTPSTEIYFRSDHNRDREPINHRIEISFSSGRINNAKDRKELEAILDETAKIENVIAKFAPTLNKMYEDIRAQEMKIWEMRGK